MQRQYGSTPEMIKWAHFFVRCHSKWNSFSAMISNMKLTPCLWCLVEGPMPSLLALILRDPARCHGYLLARQTCLSWKASLIWKYQEAKLHMTWTIATLTQSSRVTQVFPIPHIPMYIMPRESQFAKPTRSQLLFLWNGWIDDLLVYSRLSLSFITVIWLPFNS